MPELLIDKYEVSPNDELTKDHVIVSLKADYGWTDIMSLGNLSTVIGKAKSRKTFFIALLTASIVSNKNMRIKSRIDGNIVIFDTEQGKYHVWLLTKRIKKMLDHWPGTIKVFGLRPLNVQERIDIIEKYLYMNDHQFVVIDGIRDLVTDINSADQATDIVGRLMKWSYERDCHICSVLHQNKGDENARGHIGTEIVNKSETVIAVSIQPEKQYSLVKSVYTRGMEFKDFQFKIEDGIPIIDETEVLSFYDKDDTDPF